MEQIREEVNRLRERQHEVVTEIAALRLELANTRSDVRQLKADRDKFVPIIERLDDEDIERRAVARAAAEEAASTLGDKGLRVAVMVGLVGLLSIAANFIIAGFLHH